MARLCSIQCCAQWFMLWHTFLCWWDWSLLEWHYLGHRRNYVKILCDSYYGLPCHQLSTRSRTFGRFWQIISHCHSHQSTTEGISFRWKRFKSSSVTGARVCFSVSCVRDEMMEQEAILAQHSLLAPVWYPQAIIIVSFAGVVYGPCCIPGKGSALWTRTCCTHPLACINQYTRRNVKIK